YLMPNDFATIAWSANSLPLSEVIVFSIPLYGRSTSMMAAATSSEFLLLSFLIQLLFEAPLPAPFSDLLGA
ncbi:hypothetical protein, partial [Fibrobacter sp.]|uniref:hypothetical protein n=1 Tax=Fibrobacter sp. TaxID=35828 RepID=UPI00388EB7A4